MDDPALDAGEHRRALAGLARINAVSSAAGPLWWGVRGVCGPATARTSALRVLDVATGSGDVLAGLMGRARRDGIGLEASAIDVSNVAHAGLFVIVNVSVSPFGSLAVGVNE